MTHETLERLHTIAEVHSDSRHPAMSRDQRLERWVELLEQQPERTLTALAGTEYQPVAARDAMRSAGSPLTVAFEDPLLRAEGLKDDTYGEAKRFFEITDRQLHRIVCYCHVGAEVRAGTTARHVRRLLALKQTGRFRWLRQLLAI